MNLVTKTGLNFLAITLFVFFAGSLIFYILIRSSVDTIIYSDLADKKIQFLSGIKREHNVADSTAKPMEMMATPLNYAATETEYLADTAIFNKALGKYEIYRQLIFTTQVKGKWFEIRIFKLLNETDTLIVRVLLITILICILFLISLFISNRYVMKESWKGFYDTIGKLENYDISKRSKLNLAPTDITEFQTLNLALMQMTEKIEIDYLSLKEFTENTSHEIQTPLAIINSKLEMLMQAEGLNNTHYELIGSALEAIGRLSKLNKSLILITKIENNQYPEASVINLSTIVPKYIYSFEEIIENKNITVTKKIDSNIEVLMNEELAQIVVQNLLSNAIRHNKEFGEISIELTTNKLVIANTGTNESLDERKVFERFNKNSQSPRSIGLGLSIVKKVCDLYKKPITYTFENQMHKFTIQLN